MTRPQCTNASHPNRAPVDMNEMSRTKAGNGTVHVTHQCPVCGRMATSTDMSTVKPIVPPWAV